MRANRSYLRAKWQNSEHKTLPMASCHAGQNALTWNEAGSQCRRRSGKRRRRPQTVKEKQGGHGHGAILASTPAVAMALSAAACPLPAHFANVVPAAAPPWTHILLRRFRCMSVPGMESFQQFVKIHLLSDSVNLPGAGDRISIEIGWELESELEN